MLLLVQVWRKGLTGATASWETGRYRSHRGEKVNSVGAVGMAQGMKDGLVGP